MTKTKTLPLKGKRTYAAVTSLAAVILAQKLSKHLPAEAAQLLASELVTYAELALAAAALYFRAQATAEHTDTQAKPSKGPDFWP